MPSSPNAPSNLNFLHHAPSLPGIFFARVQPGITLRQGRLRANSAKPADTATLVPNPVLPARWGSMNRTGAAQSARRAWLERWHPTPPRQPAQIAWQESSWLQPARQHARTAKAESFRRVPQPPARIARRLPIPSRGPSGAPDARQDTSWTTARKATVDQVTV